MPPIDPDAEIVVTHFRLDLRGFDSVDVIATKPDGTELKTFREINWDPEDGSVYAVCEAPLARISAQAGRIISTVIGTRAGQKEVIARFESFTAPAPAPQRPEILQGDRETGRSASERGAAQIARLRRPERLRTKRRSCLFTLAPNQTSQSSPSPDLPVRNQGDVERLVAPLGDGGRGRGRVGRGRLFGVAVAVSGQ